MCGNTAPATQASEILMGGKHSAFKKPRPILDIFGATYTGDGIFKQSMSTGTDICAPTRISATVASGTAIKYNPPTGTDMQMEGGMSSYIRTRYQCITCMKEYANESLEELRIVDYAANSKSGAAGLIAFGGTTQQNEELFGLTSPASTSRVGFGVAAQSKPPFRTSGTKKEFAGAINLLGRPAQAQITGLFGSSVSFGAKTTAAPVYICGGTNTMGSGTPLFGQSNQQRALLRQTTGTVGGIFESTATTQSAGFGNTSSLGRKNQTSAGCYGDERTVFGTTKTTTTNNSDSFGNTGNMSAILFEEKTAVHEYGANAGFSAQNFEFGSFGTTSTTRNAFPTEIINYIPETGSSVVRVAHPLKRGLQDMDIDEDMDVCRPSTISLL